MTQPAQTAESAAPISSVPTVLILDGSGSMAQADAPGPRIDAAKSAAHGLVDALPDQSSIALQTYGTTTGSAVADREAGCRDVSVLLSLRPLDRPEMDAAIDSISPSGYTPISLALQVAAEQLSSDSSPQAIVLVSDGEDTCDTPPCDTATELKRSRPGLTISTVGFKVDGPAADQLRCIAESTGGIYVQAANAAQLAARLLATQNIDRANNSLSSTGIGDIELGSSIGDIRAAHPDFPDAATTGSVTVIWQDCSFAFVDGTLDAIAPDNGGFTIDGVTVGDPVAKAASLYGKPLAATANSDGTTSVLFSADPNTDNAYKTTVSGFAENDDSVDGTITSIVLCRCKPKKQGPIRPTDVTEDTIRNMTFPAGTCGNSSKGWENTVPITVRDGEGEARTPSGDFGGASITDAALVGWLDADADGTEDALVEFTCFGSTIDMCCAGRSSMMQFVRVFDFSSPSSPRPVGETIMPGESPVRGENYGESRYFERVRIDGSSVITDEKLIYADTSGATAALDHPPDATIEVIHRFTDGQWTSTERVIR
jgi:Ca-activated chloride channel family protein